MAAALAHLLSKLGTRIVRHIQVLTKLILLCPHCVNECQLHQPGWHIFQPLVPYCLPGLMAQVAGLLAPQPGPVAELFPTLDPN